MKMSTTLNLTSFMEKMKNLAKERLENNSIEVIETKYKCPICKDTGLVLKDEKTNTYTDCKCREKERLNTLWKNFGVDINDIKLLRDYKSYNEETKKAKEKAVNYINSFGECNNWFCLMGTPGGGKTHIVKAIGKALIDKNISVVYMPYLEAIRELKSCTMNQEYYLRLISKYTKAKVLIIDDLFKDKVKNGKVVGELKESDLKQIYTILNFRYQNNLPTLISTECNPNLLMELDEALCGRILEKCGKEFGHVFTKNSNYRLRAFM